MNFYLQQLLLFAEENAPAPPAGGGSNFIYYFPVIILLFFLFQMFFATSPQRREQKRLDELKSTLKKNDPVVTAGGILGTVANVSPEKNEVTIKVDDNTRLRVQMRSVVALPKESAKDGKDTAKPEPPASETKST